MVPAHRPFYTKLVDIDLYTGMRAGQMEHISGEGVSAEERRASIQEIQLERKKKWYQYPMGVVHALF